MSRAYLGLGTNMGDRLDYLNKACLILENSEHISHIKKSKLYETKAWGYTDQADFLNMCVEIDTDLNQYELLDLCQSIENELNRVRLIRWGPRTIDVDILFYDNVISDDEKLTIPHPRIKDRAFVLIPLIDLNKNLMIEGKSITEHLDNLSDDEKSEVKEFKVK